MDSLMAVLRGSWEYHTYYDRWTMDFITDRQLLVDHKPGTYSIKPGALRVNVEGKQTDYQFNLQDDRLTLADPDGRTVDYNHRDAGEVEQTVDGKFYTQIDSLSRASITFQDGKNFTLGSMKSIDNDISQTISSEGIYRVEGDLLYLVFNDGNIDTAEIRYRDPDESANGIIFHERLYDKEELRTETPSGPIIITTYNPPPPIPDPPGPIDWWYPPPTVYIPVAPTSPPPKPVADKDRDFGSTRDASKPAGTADSHREGNRATSPP
jgi:hypothetical protein